MIPLRVAGLAALASAAASVFGAASLALFFVSGQPWGTINDLDSVLLVVLIVPIAIGMKTESPTSGAKVAAAVGLTAIAAVTALQSLLLLRLMTFDIEGPLVVAAEGFVGIWLASACWFAYQAGFLSRLLLGMGALAGAGYVCLAVSTIWAGMDSYGAYAGGLLAVVAYPAWAVMFGRRCLAAGRQPAMVANP